MFPACSRRPLSRRAWRALVAMAAVLVLAGCLQSSQPDNPTTDAASQSDPARTAPSTRAAPSSAGALRAALTAPGIRRHLVALQRIADEHGGNRASGTPGYDASVSYLVGELRATGYQPQLQRFRSRQDSKSATLPLTNVVAELPGTRNDRVIMIGAHLDSVAAGPGMNDNASGSAMVLELVRQLADARLPATIRFAWWDGEEPGRLGSGHYVAALDRAERERILLYLNLDMVGSPNYLRLVYAGDSDHAPPGSEVVEKLLTDYFSSQGLAVGSLEPGEGSDHAPFAAAGIPIGGLFTGVDPKTRSEQATYGGTVGAPADPCYHQACDDLTNLNLVALKQMGDATAHVLMRLALDPAALDEAKAVG
jgi:aminopeptidase S